MIPYNCADYLFIYEFNGKIVSFMYAFCGGIFCRPIRITVASVMIADWLLLRLDEGCQSIVWYRMSISSLVICKYLNNVFDNIFSENRTLL